MSAPAAQEADGQPAGATEASLPVYLVRHAHAVSRELWKGSDKHRPLTDRGAKQAQALASRFGVLADRTGPKRAPTAGRGIEPRPGLLVSSGAERCLATLRPLAAGCELPIVLAGYLSEGSDPDEVLLQLKELASSAPVAVLCSHGDVIIGVVDILKAAGTPFSGQVDVKKGSIVVLETRSGSVESVRYVPPDKV
jgi:8-oxo-dGTP diphosphatase